jgi:hypothetical protein
MLSRNDEAQFQPNIPAFLALDALAMVDTDARDRM